MAIDALVKPLLSLPLFRGLKPLQITEIARRADRIVYRPGDVITKENDTGDAAIIIIAGETARVSSGAGEAAENILEGSMIAELAMLVETVHNATVIAKSPVRAIRLSRTEMHALMQDDPSLAEHFSARITERLKRLAFELKAIDDALSEVSSFDAPIATQLSDAHRQPALFH
jgi:CRP-like cAMP-binding protein